MPLDAKVRSSRRTASRAGNHRTLTSSVTDLQLALELAARADAITMRHFGARDLGVVSKADGTPVTEADLAVERALRARLAVARPHDTVLGEEDGGGLTGGRQWVIDPIDATENYLRGNPVFATLIALRSAGQTLVAVASAPALGRRWHATRGGGAWCADARLAVSKVSDTHDAFFAYGGVSWWHSSGRSGALDRLLERCWRARGFGDFWMYMMVAEGVLDIAIEPSDLKVWDTLAPKLIVQEAGGRVTGFSADNDEDGSLVATNALLHEQVLELLADR